MSQQPLSFDQTVAEAADCYVARYGLAEAIKRLEARRGPDADARVDEALAYLKHKEGGGG